tara:strand:+ start:1129 stop:1311 length:183 start_codon:yes stop_codon:yes gene_type:complete
MITLTNLLLFLILSTLVAYLFMPWKGIDKGSFQKILMQYTLWIIILGIIIFSISKSGLII